MFTMSLSVENKQLLTVLTYLSLLVEIAMLVAVLVFFLHNLIHKICLLYKKMLIEQVVGAPIGGKTRKK